MWISTNNEQIELDEKNLFFLMDAEARKLVLCREIPK